MYFKWLALKEFQPASRIVLPDYLPENDLQLEILEQDPELEIEDICEWKE
jgi:hypothetical protein